MVNGDYWINSDGNGQTILARCEGNGLNLTDRVFRDPVPPSLTVIILIRKENSTNGS